MGNYQNKEYITTAQAQVVAGQQLESKLNYFGMVLIVIATILGVLLCYALRRGCIGHMRGWLRKEVPKLILTGAAVPGQPGTIGNPATAATAANYV